MYIQWLDLINLLNMLINITLLNGRQENKEHKLKGLALNLIKFFFKLYVNYKLKPKSI